MHASLKYSIRTKHKAVKRDQLQYIRHGDRKSTSTLIISNPIPLNDNRKATHSLLSCGNHLLTWLIARMQGLRVSFYNSIPTCKRAIERSQTKPRHFGVAFWFLCIVVECCILRYQWWVACWTPRPRLKILLLVYPICICTQRLQCLLLSTFCDWVAGLPEFYALTAAYDG